MSESYSKSESDLKIENLFRQFAAETTRIENQTAQVEQRLENKMDRLLSAFEIMNTEIGWIKTLLISSNIAILVALIGVLIPIAWTLWTGLVHLPTKP